MLRSPFLYVPLTGVLLVAFWLHSIQTPFWQDDFHFLLVAREAREAGEGWYTVFWPTSKSIFWRPLSEGLYWRLVEGVFDANSMAAHAINLSFLVFASLAVAWLVADYGRLIAPSLDWRKAFVTAGFLYGIHAAHFIPAVWATAIHTSMVVLFSALALRFWTSALHDGPAASRPGLLSVPLFLLLALFSKENGILALPMGALLTALAWNRARPIRYAWAVASVTVILAMAWLRLRQEMIVPPSGAYEMGLSISTVRNLGSMVLFFLNVPRESLRFMLEQHSAAAALWGIVCGLIQAAAVWVFVGPAISRFGLKSGAAAVAFFLTAAAPHLFFSWNSYAYYITLGLIAWPMLAVISPLSPRRIRLAIGTTLLSSSLSIAGNYALDYPALLARADWANRQLSIIRGQFPAFAEQIRARGIDVVVENRHKFLAIGADGLAFELGLSRESIREIPPDERISGSAVKLIVPNSGDAHFE